jgi:hypothetical protein
MSNRPLLYLRFGYKPQLDAMGDPFDQTIIPAKPIGLSHFHLNIKLLFITLEYLDRLDVEASGQRL